MAINTKTYPNGLRLIVNTMPDSRAVSTFFGVNTGSVNENENNNGISHVIEHMTFKGTTTRSAEDISTELESLGANINAFTSRYITCYYGTCIKDNAAKCFEIFADMLLNSKYDEEELQKELKVIFEEIDMYEDDPGSVAYDKYNEIFFEGTKLEKSVIGTKEVLSKLHRQDLIDYINEFYTPNNMVVSIAGGISFEEAEKMVFEYFASFFTQSASPIMPVISGDMILPKQKFSCTKKDISQTHIVLGYPTENTYSENRAAITVLTFILGGGMSSRLFVRIREKLGLVYSINASPELFDMAGNIVISLATNFANQELALTSIREEIDNIARNGVTEAELNKAKTFCKSMVVMSSETTTNIARHNASNLLTFGKYISIDDRLELIENVTLENVNKLAKTIFSSPNYCMAIVSDKPNEDGLKIYNNANKK